MKYFVLSYMYTKYIGTLRGRDVRDAFSVSAKRKLNEILCVYYRIKTLHADTFLVCNLCGGYFEGYESSTPTDLSAAPIVIPYRWLLFTITIVVNNFFVNFVCIQLRYWTVWWIRAKVASLCSSSKLSRTFLPCVREYGYAFEHLRGR